MGRSQDKLRKSMPTKWHQWTTQIWWWSTNIITRDSWKTRACRPGRGKPKNNNIRWEAWQWPNPRPSTSSHNLISQKTATCRSHETNYQLVKLNSSTQCLKKEYTSIKAKTSARDPSWSWWWVKQPTTASTKQWRGTRNPQSCSTTSTTHHTNN